MVRSRDGSSSNDRCDMSFESAGSDTSFENAGGDELNGSIMLIVQFCNVVNWVRRTRDWVLVHSSMRCRIFISFTKTKLHYRFG